MQVELIKRIKEEYAIAIKMHRQTGNQYWFGRMSITKELLDLIRKNLRD